jgi:hypothetical protein
MRALPQFEMVRPPAEGAITLAGPPRRLRGEVHLHNPGDERVVVQRALLSNLPLPAALPGNAQEEAAKRPVEVTAWMTAILRPGEGSRAPLVVELDPRTPPGEYQAELTLGPHSYPVQLHVASVVDLEVLPSTIVVAVPPGGRVVKRVSFRNRGNEPLEIGEIGALPLDEEFFNCRFLRATLATAGDRIEGVDQLVGEMARQAKLALERPGKLRVHNPETFVLAPGETRGVGLEIRMPDGVEPGSRYFARAALYTADLEFVLTPAPSGAKGKADPGRQT